ncbi:DNA mismatch repair endonuclease MutL [Natranaerofaba carboxydovora]|uniref:DNA mismatch repair endonuclease MutL n=1 Tax=Natranaerofaba carboxydovora TaxID=2742683 RepID=UPI001F12D9D8|nr:DNA mismatch repair endonuclease MutL [Natranaerofaba carboxydovora]UMZ73524.1 DNA mismatch repair protein MutL [Natranaerofaba carboxydovora]
MRVQVLGSEIANKIAAGEVVESPSSVIKELIENSLDAKSKTIKIYLKEAGIEKIRVIDDGVGIHPDDIELAFCRHATNKISDENDLNNITTLGFRGEALASISSVSKVEIKSKQKDKKEGVKAIFEAGELVKKELCGAPDGTDIEVNSLFYNTPARFKFLRKKQNELGYITDIVNKLSLSNPDVSFTLVHENRQILKTSGKGDLLEVIASIYGFQTIKQMLEIKNNLQSEDGKGDNGISIRGFISKPELTRASRNYQTFFVNGRYVKSKTLTDALEEGYKRFLPKGRFPIAIIKIDVPYDQVDVNVHPAKLHIRFDKIKNVVETLKKTIYNELSENELIPHIRPHQTNKKKTPKIERVKKEVRDNEKNRKYDENDIEQHKQGIIEEEIFNNEKKQKDQKGQKGQNEQDEQNEQSHDLDPSITEGITVREEPASYDYDHDYHDYNHDNEYNELNSKSVDLLDVPIKDFNIIGQAFVTYWIIEKGDKLYFVDQHSAHERVNYHKLLTEHRKNSVISQNIIPFTLEIDSSELLIVENNLENLKEVGLELEIFGNNTLLVRSVPYVVKDICDGSFVKDFVMSLASMLKEESGDISLDKSRLEETLISIACKKSIKANQKLNRAEFENLILELKSIPNPYTCPHGRPTIIKFTKYDIEKYFKRIM